MAKRFENKEALDKWIEEKNEELYPGRSDWDIDPIKVPDDQLVSALIADGYTDLGNLVEDGHAYEIAGYTNNGWLYKDEADLNYIKEMGLDIELRERG